jgi:uncharacterized protein (TIGR02246 family)
MLLRKVLSASPLLLVLALGACTASPAPADTTADVAAADAVRDAWVTAFSAGNAEGVSALYTADAIFMRNHQPTLTGQAAIRAAMQAQMDAMTTSISVTTDETMIMGDTAVGRGRFTTALTPKTEGTAPIADEGSYMTVMQRQADGTWKITRHIGNSSLPMPGAPMPAMEMK